MAKSTTPVRTPVYFFSHGGPTLAEETNHPAHVKLRELGREITQQVRPKAILIFSAHWQAESPDTIEVNTAEHTPLIYDFYGFPRHMYEWQYPNRGSPELARLVLKKLSDAGIRGHGVERGLDHGAWVPLMCAFDPKTNPVEVPIVQVSLFESEDPDQHYRLGKVMEGLREDGVLVIGSGMAVHNLRDFRRAFMSAKGEVLMDYVVSFDDALRDATETEIGKRQEAMREVTYRKDARQAHPTFEHLLPIHVAAGAAGKDFGHRLWTFPQGSVSYAQYRFGNVVV